MSIHSNLVPNSVHPVTSFTLTVKSCVLVTVCVLCVGRGYLMSRVTIQVSTVPCSIKLVTVVSLISLEYISLTSDTIRVIAITSFCTYHFIYFHFNRRFSALQTTINADSQFAHYST
jgi:hypothetical protein